jgi:hypothetical protein
MLKSIVVHGSVSDTALRILVDAIQLMQSNRCLRVTHPMQPIWGHIRPAPGCMFWI